MWFIMIYDCFVLPNIEIYFWISGKYSDMSAEFFAERCCRAQVRGSKEGGSVGGRRLMMIDVMKCHSISFGTLRKLGDGILDDIRIKGTPAQKTNSYHCK